MLPSASPFAVPKANGTASTAPPERAAVSDTPLPGATAAHVVPQAVALSRDRISVRVFWYALAFVVSSGLIAAGMRLDENDLRAPFFYDEDGLLILPMVKATIERGSHWRNERMGYPGVLELYDFPVIDHLHFAIIRLLGLVLADAIVVYNVYYLLTYPLSHLAGMAVMRHFRLSFPAAFVGGLLFAFMPYHFMRGENHYFLSAYWVVPFSTAAALWVCRGELPFFRLAESGRYRLAPWQWRSLAAVAIGLATSSAGAYYAYFACALFVAAGLYGWAALRTWRAPLSAALLVGTVFVGGVVNHLPTIVYQAAHGRNSAPHTRLSEEAEIYGLKLAHLVLPLSEHNCAALAKIKSMYNTDARPLQNENERATLGLIGTAGLLGLLSVLVLPVRKAWPYGPIAALVGFSVLVGTIGGFGAVFNQLFMNQVRCYNRISVYIGFLCYFAVVLFLDRWFSTRVGRAAWLRYPTFFGLIVVGVWDQTPYQWFRPRIVEQVGKEAERFRHDARFYREIEAMAGPGAKVFSLPFVAYPESDWTQKLCAYEHARGYLHTDTLVWSFGAMKGRETDAWQREVSVLPAPRMLERMVLRGFDGLVVDKRGYTPKRASERLKEVIDALGAQSVPRIDHPDGHEVYFDLRPYRAWLIGQQTPGGFEALARREAESVSFLWLHGFYCFEPVGSENRRRWCSKAGRLSIVNPSDRERTFRLRMLLRVDARGEFEVSLDGPLVQKSLTVTKTQPPESETTFMVRVPPGAHHVEFRCEPPDNFYSTDSRFLCFYLANFSQEEVEASSPDKK